MSKLNLDILDENRRKTFDKLKSLGDVGILGGGTALALQIGHRISYDFDIFINTKINKNIWKRAKDIFGNGSVKILESEDQLDLMTPNSIKVTFFNDDYQNLFDPIVSDSINLMDIKDIATNKALIQGKRPKWRDYVDLYFLLKDNYINFKELIDLSNKKFGSDFSEKLFLEQLVYWDDVKSFEIEFVKDDIDPETIKSFFVDTVKKHLDSLRDLI